jgi:transcriptional regulator with XRE-family HTH domain
MTNFECPICGYGALTKPPADSYICPCCGTEFGSDDFEKSRKELRAEWIGKGMPWFSRATLRPKNWNGYRQLIIANLGSDLIAHARFKAEFQYRFEVNKAWSEVRIGKQLKVLRETRKEQLTQSMLAQKAEMKQSRISELEGMNYESWSKTTMERLAKALGVGIKYSFAGWGDMVSEIESGLSPEELWIPSFEDDPAFRVVQPQVERKPTILANLVPAGQKPNNVFSLAQYRSRITSEDTEQEVVEKDTENPLRRAASGGK